MIVRHDGSVAATEGHVAEASATLPDRAGLGGRGRGRVAPRPDACRADPLGASDEALLRLSAEYVAAALRTGRREDEQAAALSGLSQDRAQVDSSGARLYEALLRHAAARSGLQVFALGPLRVTHGDDLDRTWGGEKAGTRQAQGLFAFLFDRGERGVAKDEVLDLIWPDTEVERADLAFHRTLGGLRHTLDPPVAASTPSGSTTTATVWIRRSSMRPTWPTSSRSSTRLGWLADRA